MQFIESEKLAFNEYLKKINFIAYWNDNFDRNHFQQAKKDTNLFLWKLENTRLLPYTYFAKRYFEDHFVLDKSMEAIGVILAELFNNIIDHAKSTVSGFTTTQFFPVQQKISISICDMGIGIVESVKQFLLKKNGTEVTSEEAFSKALLKGFSTESTPQNRGYGLDTLLTIVQSNNGKLRIQSNDILYIYENNSAKFINSKDSFSGTSIDIVLNIDNFYEKEELNLDNFDF